MELKDFVVTPLFIIILLVVAYQLRPYLTNHRTRIYFFPALVFRMACALLLGLLYQYYYEGGDTYNYHTHGSSVIYEAIVENPIEGFKLLFSNGDATQHPYIYASRIPYFGNASSMMVIKIATFFDIFTFKTYSATAVIFAFFGFIGAWLLYKTFDKIYPVSSNLLAFSILFVPSILFWGSGILKDTITLSALGISFYAFYNLIIVRRKAAFNSILLGVGFYLIYVVKIYILMCFIPAALILAVMSYTNRINKVMLRWMIYPFVALITLFMTVLLLNEIAERDPRYSLENLAKTAQITAYDIAYGTGKDAGSTYALGELDGSFQKMISLGPKAINVALFRPYLWEVQSPLMLISALESLIILFLTLIVLIRSKVIYLKYGFTPIVVFCLTFSLVFAFAVGVSTFNFGTLSRYRIPLLPFYLSGLVIIHHEVNKFRKSLKVD